MVTLHLVKLNINLTVQRWIEELLTSSYLDSCKALCCKQFELNAKNTKLCNSLQATKHDVAITPQTNNANIVITQFYNTVLTGAANFLQCELVWIQNGNLRSRLPPGSLHECNKLRVQGWRQRRTRGGLAPPIDMLSPPINKLSLLKTAAFVLNFKLWPPPDKRLAP